MRFRLGVLAAIAVGAAIRIAYLFGDGGASAGGDGFFYSLDALRVADGLGYTSSAWGDVGNQIAHHPPAWVTLLALVSMAGGRTIRAHQLVGVGIGLGVIALAGAIGRRYVGKRAGVTAAFIAALYPGFWVLDAAVLSEPLGLLVFGAFALIVADLLDKPTLTRSFCIGATIGFLALVRSEQSALLAMVVAPVLFGIQSLTPRLRILRMIAVAIAFAAVVSPWAIYNSTRFARPVLLSTNFGGSLLAGNCPQYTYSGEYLGYFREECGLDIDKNLDRSERSAIYLGRALRNIGGHLDRLPVVVAARLGRTFGVFRPTQTVDLTANWMGTGVYPIWAWVVSYWLLIPFAVAGTVSLYRSDGFLLPLVGPLVLAFLVTVVFFGEPRMHTPSDLAVVVLAAAGLDRMVGRQRVHDRTRSSSVD